MQAKTRIWLPAAAIALTAAFVTPTFAQMPTPDESSRQRAGSIRKEQRRKAIDQAYEAAQKRTSPESKERADPWAGLRGNSQTSQKK